MDNIFNLFNAFNRTVEIQPIRLCGGTKRKTRKKTYKKKKRKKT
jgi:hypothetical protein